MRDVLRSICIFAVLAMMPIGAAAQSLKSMNTATEQSTVIASEEPCGLSCDQEAIARYIEKNVAADDMGFAFMLSLMTIGQGAHSTPGRHRRASGADLNGRA